MKDYLSVLEKTRLFKNIEPSDLEHNFSPPKA